MNDTVIKEGPNGWREWSKHVLKELERGSHSQEVIEARLQTIETDLAVLRVEFRIKSGVWGLVESLRPPDPTHLT